MNLSSFAARFHDYELSLDYYHGKDMLHEGCLLRLNTKSSWDKISSKIRNKIRKAQTLDVRIEHVKGSEEDIKRFRTVWFDPEDTTIPSSLEEDEIMYMAYLKDTLVAGLILTPSSPKTLYMHNLGGNDTGKRNNIPGLLLWHAVEDLESSEYDFIDVGVSFRPTLYTFFKNWQTDSYPIIFSPPFIQPTVSLTPFSSSNISGYHGISSHEALKVAGQYFGDTFTILPRAIYCFKVLMKYLGITGKDEVAIYKTYDNEYITRCVTNPIESFGKVGRTITSATKAVVVIHEFGHPYRDIHLLKKECETRGIPLIEDCAWSYGTAIDDKTRIGEVGDYAIYSLPKILPMQYGAVLKGLSINDEDNWNTYQLLDYFKRELVLTQLQKYLPTLGEANEKRRANWKYLAKLFAQDGFEAFATLDSDVYPGAFLVTLNDIQTSFKRYEEFGVEAGRYYPEQALFLPVHQNLTHQHLDYIYGVFRGQLNLSSNYRRDSK